MSELVARTGRHQQRYDNGYRLVAGCIPYKYRDSDGSEGATSEKVIEVLMINSSGREDLLFPKGGWENDETVKQAAEREALEEAGVRGKLEDSLGVYDFKSKSEGLCRAEVFPLLVNEELDVWPEKVERQRSWLTLTEAIERCRYPWMRQALEGFVVWHANDERRDSDNTGVATVTDGIPEIISDE